MGNKGKIYEAYVNSQFYYIFRAYNYTEVDCNEQYDLGYIDFIYIRSNKYTTHSTTFYNWVKNGYILKEASEENIKWLEACEKAGKFIPKNLAITYKKEEINNNYSIF